MTAGGLVGAARPSDWWVLDLERDPTPGDPDAVRRLAKTFSDFAYDVAAAELAISGMGGDDVITRWVGESGDAFRAEFQNLPPDLKKLHTSYDMCAQALETYAPKLEAAQRQADQALANGRTAHDDLQRAQSQLTGAQGWVKTANQQAQKYQSQPAAAPKPDPTQVAQATRNAQAAIAAQSQAQGAVDTAQARLNAAKTLAGQAEQLRVTAAKQCADDIHRASNAGIHNLHWWQRAFNWVADHWGQIISVLKVIAFVLAIVVLIVGGPLAWVLVGISAILTINALVKAVEGKGSWWDVVFNALGCIPVTEGLTSLGAMKAEISGFTSALRAAEDSAPGASGILKTVLRIFSRGGNAPEALHSGNATQELFDQMFPEIKEVNPRFGDGWPWANNCQSCVVAVDRTLDGAAASAIGRPRAPMPDFPWPEGVTDVVGGGEPFVDVEGYDEISRQIGEAGDGARGIVWGLRVDKLGRPVAGHVFNVVNRGGRVMYIDGQVNGFAFLEQYSHLQFLRTN